ncbi:hypothetical protein OF83DRAFT_1104510 [Amylostereum chailletii]|nr:hypothetical protein OF83DRAFT_1104510 [Amylostereum chailletii]
MSINAGRWKNSGDFFLSHALTYIATFWLLLQQPPSVLANVTGSQGVAHDSMRNQLLDALGRSRHRRSCFSTLQITLRDAFVALWVYAELWI